MQFLFVTKFLSSISLKLYRMNEKQNHLERISSRIPRINECLENSFSETMNERDRAVTAVKSAQVRLEVLKKEQELAQLLQERILEVKAKQKQIEREWTEVTRTDQLSELQQKVDLWEKVSGAWVRVTDRKELKIHFSRLKDGISPRDCYVTLNANSGDVWEIKDCKPTVPGLQPLLDNLNETKDLRKFCTSVREGFKALIL